MPEYRSRFPLINAYIATQAVELQSRLNRVCEQIEIAVPEAEGQIRYQMPAYTYHGSLVLFAAFKKHIGFYPATDSVFVEFAEELRTYKQSGRGTVQFPHAADFPYDLIRRIALYRAQENRTSEAKSLLTSPRV